MAADVMVEFLRAVPRARLSDDLGRVGVGDRDVTAQLCQSVRQPILPGRTEMPCRFQASETLFGIHLCGTHAWMWQMRLTKGQKIKVHPDRALPVAKRAVELQSTGTKRCPKCGVVKPLSEFPRRASGVVSYCILCNREQARVAYYRKRAEKRGSGASNDGALPAIETCAPRPHQRVGGAHISPHNPHTFVEHKASRNAETLTVEDEATEPSGLGTAWPCTGHAVDQIGGKRCVRCCTARDLSYVWRNAAGGSPGAWRWLCAPCQGVYEAIGLMGAHRTHVEAFSPETSGYDERVMRSTGLAPVNPQWGHTPLARAPFLTGVA